MSSCQIRAMSHTYQDSLDCLERNIIVQNWTSSPTGSWRHHILQGWLPLHATLASVIDLPDLCLVINQIPPHHSFSSSNPIEVLIEPSGGVVQNVLQCHDSFHQLIQLPMDSLSLPNVDSQSLFQVCILKLSHQSWSQINQRRR